MAIAPSCVKCKDPSERELTGGEWCRSKAGLDGKSFHSFFQDQPAARNRRHVKRHDAATAIAVGIVAHHALALVLTGWPERKSL